jgi:hypothetical protein
MRRSLAILAVAGALLLSSCARKGSPEASNPNPEAPAAAQSGGGPHVFVHLKDGTKIPGTIVASSQSDMTVAGDDGIERKMPMAQVSSVEYGEAQPAPPAPPPVATTRTYELLPGTEVSVRTNEGIDSGVAAEGQTFAVQVTRDAKDANGDVVIPRGSRARVVIKSASKGGRFRGASDLVLDLQTVTIDGRRYTIDTADISQKGKSGVGANKRTAEYTGGGAALGAIIGAILAVYFLALELTGNLWASILAMFILTGSQFFLKYATHAMTDVPCTFFFTLALLLYAIGLRRPPYLALAGVPVAAAILTRSVIGIIPLGIMAVHMAAVGRGRLLRSPQWICACAIAVFPPLLWMASQYYFYGNYFLHEHFSFIAGKVAGEAATAPALSLRGFYYLGALLRFYWPWLPFLAIGLVVEVRAAVSRRDSAAILVLLWVLFIIGPFSLADTKYARYLLPAFPALAILSAAGVRRVVSQARLGIAFNVACLLLFLVAAGAVAFPSRERAADMRRLAPVAEAHSDPAERVLIYAGHDYENEFLWYSHRYSELVTDMDELKDRLVEGEKITGIIDRASFEALLKQLPPPCARKIERLADSQGFVCYRANHE